ncbi:MAG: hypothetical protein OEZ16_06415 [Chromatiales bacterium]|nr:hypothetical protein [Chromatiales bacterium]
MSPEALRKTRDQVKSTIYESFEKKRKELKIDKKLDEELLSVYIPLAEYIIAQAEKNKSDNDSDTYFCALSGAQGSGKTTWNEFLQLIIEEGYEYDVAGFSIDDVYNTYDERQKLAQDHHPLLATRGPGTHDIDLTIKVLENLSASGDGREVIIPQFDKSLKGGAGDRAEEGRTYRRRHFNKPLIVILEGWNVFAEAQDESALLEPLNELERIEDPDGIWRKFQNDRLKNDYSRLWDKFDGCIFIQISGIDTVYKNREEQEEKLRKKIDTMKAAGEASEEVGAMSPQQVVRFVDHYARITKEILRTLPQRANVVVELNDDRSIKRTYVNVDSTGAKVTEDL